VTEEYRWIECRVDNYDLIVLELAVRHIPPEEMEYCIPQNDDSKFVYMGNIRRLKSEINTVCQADSETRERLCERIDVIIAEQDAAKEASV